jgi:hypothetical protein
MCGWPLKEHQNGSPKKAALNCGSSDLFHVTFERWLIPHEADLETGRAAREDLAAAAVQPYMSRKRWAWCQQPSDCEQAHWPGLNGQTGTSSPWTASTLRWERSILPSCAHFNNRCATRCHWANKRSIKPHTSLRSTEITKSCQRLWCLATNWRPAICSWSDKKG